MGRRRIVLEWTPKRPPPHRLEKDRTRALQLLKAFGYASNSFQALESGYRYWFFEHPEGEVFIPFVPVRGFAVIPGGPVGPQAAIEGALNAFSTFAHKEGRRLLIVGAEPWLNDCLAAQNGAYDFVKLGEQPEWDPSSFSIEGPERKNVRAQINRARNKGVIVRRVSVKAGVLVGRLGWRLSTSWVAGWIRGTSASWWTSSPSLKTERRYYVAESGDELVGFLSAVPVYTRSGWFFEDVIRVPEAPNGTAELLIYEAMEDARRRGDQYVTLGLSPLAGIDQGPGEHRVLRWGLRQFARRFGALYGFEGLRQFRRFGLTQWTPICNCPQRACWTFSGLGGVQRLGARLDLRLRLRQFQTHPWPGVDGSGPPC